MSRTSKSLSARIAPGVPEKANGLRRARRAASWGLAALALCWLLWNRVEGDDRVYHAGSISSAHQFIANDCARCHQDSWQPLKRLVTFNNAPTSTPDAACLACHDGAPHNDHPAASMAHCAHCHREHHGQETLAALDDRFCTDCHANLADHGAPPFHFAERIKDFSEHPEFALFRSDVGPATENGPNHGVHRVAETTDSPDAPFRDRSTLRFNHHKHLQPADPRGLPTPALRENGVEITAAGFEQLDCADCHQLDRDGAYFQPISFEQSCRRCHPLQFDANLLLGDALPHREPTIVIDVMRARLAAAFSNTSPRDMETSASPNDNIMPGPPGFEPVRPGELAWVNERLAAAEHVVFGREAKGGCRFCHEVSETSQGYAIAPNSIPTRWQEHARFNHERHRLLDCTACHDQTLTSATSADILLPRIASCRACHGAGSDKSGHASDACVECHDYHDHRLDHWAGTLGLGLEPVEPRRRGGAEGEGVRKEGAR